MEPFNVDLDKNYQAFDKLLTLQTQNKNIFIYGKPGVGKTTFLYDFSKKINNQKVEISGYKVPKFNIMFFNVNDWIKDVQKTWKEENTFEGSIKINTQANILLIDDLGSEFFHKSTMPSILNLFEERYEHVQKNRNNSITLITSNYSLDELKDKYSNLVQDKAAIERLFSRIDGVIDKEIRFIGKDKRKEKNNLER
ncbi:ATP-binding protein [Spiroplasma endosymbiont of Cantharis lateralis]|uniref:ATP-binding protein n=1 Tax=Spiroplasma endosymbiont of Cantharis lateralis TaxID=3066277 RepID=UPI00313D2440